MPNFQQNALKHNLRYARPGDAISFFFVSKSRGPCKVMSYERVWVSSKYVYRCVLKSYTGDIVSYSTSDINKFKTLAHIQKHYPEYLI